MAIGIEGLGLLAHARATGADFTRIVTAGRHNLGMRQDQLSKFFNERKRQDLALQLRDERPEGYCETLLKTAFGAEVVDSIDASSYENATLIHDMNTPIAIGGDYGLVLDFGTLEHVFNLATAFDNLERLCAPNGRILHMSPCNNFAGHGFYQFSPELFFRIYAPERGFINTTVYLTSICPSPYWYQVRDPSELKARVNLTSREQLLILVMTTKAGTPKPLATHPVQQSDYSSKWNDEERGRSENQSGLKALESKIRNAFPGATHRHKVRRKDVKRHSRKDISRVNLLQLVPNF
jgi:hypothetical protein